MGANEFKTVSFGKTAAAAFEQAVLDAKHEYGHGGYTGSIAEKRSFVEVKVPSGMSVRSLAVMPSWSRRRRWSTTSGGRRCAWRWWGRSRAVHEEAVEGRRVPGNAGVRVHRDGEQLGR